MFETMRLLMRKQLNDIFKIIKEGEVFLLCAEKSIIWKQSNWNWANDNFGSWLTTNANCACRCLVDFFLIFIQLYFCHRSFLTLSLLRSRIACELFPLSIPHSWSSVFLSAKCHCVVHFDKFFVVFPQKISNYWMGRFLMLQHTAISRSQCHSIDN